MARAVKKKIKPAKAKKSAGKTIKKTIKKTRPKAKKSVPAKAPSKAKPSKASAPRKAGSLKIGSNVPDFTMPATRLGAVSPTSLKGKPFILYFYPKDDTSGCTAEACEFRNTMPAFDKLGIVVIGVSKDGLESHEKFARKYNLNFPLASDESGAVCEKFGTWIQKSMYGRSYMGIDRSTFLIDGKGVIRAIWRKVSVSGHIDDVKKAVEAL